MHHEHSMVTHLQADAMLYLQKHPNSTVSSLGKHLQLSSSAITQLVERLEKSGFIKREDSPDDRRIIVLSLTTKGDHVISHFHGERMKHMKKIVSLLPKKDAKELIRISSNLFDKMEDKK